MLDPNLMNHNRPEPGDRGGWRGGVIAVALVALVIVLFAAMAFFGGGSQDGTIPAQTPGAPATQSAPQGTAAPGAPATTAPAPAPGN